MRYLGVDYGAKRMGVAVSDDEGKIAFPQSVLPVASLRKAAGEIARIARDEHAGMIVVGMPRVPGREETDQTHETRHFVELLKEHTPLPVETEDELLTSKIAEAHSSRDTADASAAALILQAYLDKKPEARNPKSEANSNDQISE